MGDMNERLLISLIIIYIFIGFFAPLFIEGFSFGIIDKLFGITGEELCSGGGCGIGDVIQLIISGISFISGFILLPIQAVTDNSLTGILKVVFFFLGLLNDFVLLFYIKGFL